MKTHDQHHAANRARNKNPGPQAAIRAERVDAGYNQRKQKRIALP